MVVTIGLILVGVAIVLIVYIKMLQKENTNLILQENLIREHYSTLEYQIEQTRRIRHDIANHIFLIEQLASQDGGQEELSSDYKNELEKTVQSLQCQSFCEEILVNSVIKNKLRECQSRGVWTECQVEKLSVGDMERIDMLGLLYNVFDNAIEACELVDTEGRWIRINMKNEENMLILICRNSKNPNVSLKDGQKTTKKDKENHGIGKDIMNSIVKKYHGSIVSEDRKDEYYLKIVCRCNGEKVQGEI